MTDELLQGAGGWVVTQERAGVTVQVRPELIEGGCGGGAGADEFVEGRIEAVGVAGYPITEEREDFAEFDGVGSIEADVHVMDLQ
jgi:hypothetical protein